MSQGTIYTKVQYAGQTSSYTSAASSSFTAVGRTQSCELNSNNALIFDRGLGEGLNISNAYYGPFETSGSITFNPVDFDFLKHWIGGLTGAGSSGDHYILNEATEVALSTSSTALQPFTIERLNDMETTDSVEQAVGCVGTDFTLSGAVNEKLVCNANFIARHTQFKTSGAQTYNAKTDSSFTMLNGTWKWGSTPTAISGVREFSITYNNQIVTDTRSIESRFLGQPVMGQRLYNFSCGIIMTSGLATTIINDFYGYSNGGVYSPEDGSTSITPTASLEFKVELVNGSNYAYLQLDECVIDRISKPSSLGGGLVILTFEGTAFKGLGNKPIEFWTT